jgi:hypothetical protein
MTLDDKKIEDTISGLLGWVQTKKADVQTQGQSWNWVTGLVASVVVFFALAFAAYSAWKKGKEIAALKHEIDVKKEEEALLVIKTKLEHDADERKLLEAKSAQINHLISESKKAVSALEAERYKKQAVIDKITNWNDVSKVIEDLNHD